MVIPERLNRYIAFEPNSGCWLWLGGLARGYAMASWNGKNVRAARLFYQLANGVLPSDLEIDHLCRTRCCVNPDHLEAVPHALNMVRSKANHNNGRKTHCLRGHPLSGSNLMLYPGMRTCRICALLRAKRYYENRKQSTR